MMRLKLAIATLIIGMLLGAFGYIKLLQYQRDTARQQAKIKPIETEARVRYETAIERIKKVEERFNDEDNLSNTGVDNIDWMW